MRNMMIMNEGRLMTQQMGMMTMLQRAQFSTANAPKVQIKVNKNTVTSEIGVLEQQLPKAPAPELFFPQVAKAAVPKNPTWIARKFGIDYSVYKLNACAMLIRNKHIYDALGVIENCAKKGGKIVNSVL